MNRNERILWQDPDRVDLINLIDDLWKAAKRWWLGIFIFVSLMSSAGYFFTVLTYQPVYTAYSTFTVNAVSVHGYARDSYNTTMASQLGKVFSYLLTNDTLMELVARDMGTDEIDGTIEAVAVKDTNLITLTVCAAEGQTAYDILHSVIKNYPAVSDYVLGDVELNLLDESGVPGEASNELNYKRNALIGGATGLVLAAVFLLIQAMTRNTVSSEEELRKAFNLPCLGNIPEVSRRDRPDLIKNGKGLTIDAPHMQRHFVEAVRTVRNRVLYKCESMEINTIIVTSAVPGEGKSTIAVNLALSIAQRNQKVLLIDGDLRSPSVGTILGTEQAKGLYEFLTGEAALQEILWELPGEINISVISGGKEASNPQELLSSPKLQELISANKPEYDYIIIDTPPSAMVSDASMIARFADAGIFVVRQDYGSVEVLREGMGMLSGTEIIMLGTVLNYTTAGITGRGSGYGNYGYGRYGSYGYGYGYNDHYGSSDDEEV